MAASPPLSFQGGVGVSSIIEGCTPFASAVDKEGVNNPPSDRINLELPIQQAELNFELYNKFLAFMNINSGASNPVSVSAPAALGAPPQIDVSASNLPSVLLTQSGTTNPGPWSSVSQVRSTPRVVMTPSSSDRTPRSLPPFGDPRIDHFSGRASQTRERSNLRVHELSGRASVPLFTASSIPSNSGIFRGAAPHGSTASCNAPLPFGTSNFTAPFFLGCPFSSGSFGLPFY